MAVVEVNQDKTSRQTKVNDIVGIHFYLFRTGNYYFGSKQNLLQAHMRSHRKHASSVKSKE